MRLHRPVTRAACLLAVALSFLLVPAGAGADPHAVQIDEVLAGAFGRPDLQFVELRLNGCQADWGDGARLAFFDAAGNPVGTSNFPADTALFCHSVLIATQAYADLPVGDPDFLMPPALVPGSGKVCFQNPTAVPPVELCLSYGNFTGDSDQGSPGNAPALVPTRTCSLRRLALFDSFGNPSFNEDFGLSLPFPRGGSLSIPPRFNDVSFLSPFALSIEALFNAGVTGGCGNGGFCPHQAVTREQMAVLLLRSAEGPAFMPPACSSPAFGDVPCSSPFAPWINELAARGITGGCGGGNFCPGVPVSRDQMAVFLLLALEGTGFTPPACTSPVFGDVPCSSPFAPWVQELAARGITAGCGGAGMGNFCPGSAVTREQMAVFLTYAFDLPVPSFNCSDGPPPPEEEEEDDHGDTLATATPIVPGVPAAGVLETDQDQDVFSFQAQEGALYSVEVPIVGRPGGAFLAVVDANGEDVGLDFGSRFGRAVFWVPASGTYFVVVFPSFPGDHYEVRLQGPIVDDHGDSRETATPLPLNVPTAGQAEQTFDKDFFAFEVEAGRVYTVELAGQHPFAPELRITDAAGQSVAFDTTSFSGISRIKTVFAAPQTGTLFAEVSSFFSFELGVGGPGPYEVVVNGPFDDLAGGTAATAAPLAPGVPVETQLPQGDVDVFSFTGQVGKVYLLEVAGVVSGGSLTLELLGINGATVLGSTQLFGGRDGLAFTAPHNGTFFGRVSGGPAVYRIQVLGPLTDDHGDTSATATPLPEDGAEVHGSVEVPDDVDVFSFAVTAFDVFVVELTDATFFPTLQVVDAAGNTVASDSRSVVIKPEVSGTLFARVGPSDFAPHTGAYRIRVRPAADDHGDWATEATLVTPGSPAVPARIDFHQDWDFFAFDAVQGQVYTIKLQAPAGFSPGLMRLFDTDGETPLGDDQLNTLRFTAAETGRYFLRVRGSLWVTYKLTIGPGVTP